MTEKIGCGQRFFSAPEGQFNGVFPDATSVGSLAMLYDIRQSGVFFVSKGEGRVVGRIVGVCPNFENGACKLKENCVLSQRK